MADPMIINVESDDGNCSKKSTKRKRASQVESVSAEEREYRINALHDELNGLFKYYKEILEPKLVGLEDLSQFRGSLNSAIACLLEESRLPLSKLVDEIYGKLKKREGNASFTVASVKSTVLLIGQRSFYGVPDADADVLENDSESCLWCWETRDLKLMPKSERCSLKIRRLCRKKIHERIIAVSAMMIALQKSDIHQNLRQELTKASERLGKVLSEADIRLLVESMAQKNGTMAEKEAKREEKILLKQRERNKREVEKEKERMEREFQKEKLKEKLQSEKELKRLQDEAEKEKRQREKEESEMRKQLRKQQEEAGKDQRRREKEEAELKKQFVLQKQASLMERFLKISKHNLSSQNDHFSTKEMNSDSSPNRSENMPKSVTLSMDCVLSKKDEINPVDIWKMHLSSWRRMRAMRSNQKHHWGIRQKPKSELVKKLKLTTSRGLARDDELTIEKFSDGWGETNNDGKSCHITVDSSLPSGQKPNRRKQLLQFDKSYRPPFFGIWPKKSHVVGSRHPFVKDPNLDYEIDSDEEWEEEEPGESLSDCDKDDEEERLEEGYSKVDDEDDSEDGFFVPDGYLSENEGVQVDRMEPDSLDGEARSSPTRKHEVESEEFCILLRQQKYLHNLTDHALRKNQPLIILNLMHEKAPLLLADDLTGTLKLEQMCLQALSMRAVPGGPPVEISIGNNLKQEDQEGCSSSSRANTTPGATATAILETDLPQIVAIIQSCSQSINKVVETLQHKFPTISKSQLRNKVREISDFMENRWQVKKDILDKLGLTVSPEKGSGRTKSIATFFSKRCLPPSKTVNRHETSPESSQKPATAVQLMQDYTCNH